MTTHDTVLAAIEKARRSHEGADGTPLEVLEVVVGRDDHCDDLLAIAERHEACRNGGLDGWWPCPDYQQVIDRLTAWGVL